MKQFAIFLYALITNIIVVEGINIIVGFKLGGADVLTIAMLTTAIGLTLAWLLKIAIRMARDHQA